MQGIIRCMYSSLLDPKISKAWSTFSEGDRRGVVSFSSVSSIRGISRARNFRNSPSSDLEIASTKDKIVPWT